MKQLIIVAILTCCTSVIADSKYKVPSSYKTEDSVLPVSYLEALKIENTQEKLSAKDKKALACLLIDAAVQSVKLYEQTYYIKDSAPVIKLFLTNYSEYNDKRWEFKGSENGGSIALSDIESYLRENLTIQCF